MRVTWRVRAVLIEQLSPEQFPPFFPQEKQEKQDMLPNFGNLMDGKMSGTLRIPIFVIFSKGKSGN